MHNAIEIRDLRYAYPDDQAAEHVVFEDLNLDIRQGSFVAVLGHNGCGKSTLAKHLNAILLPEGGSVTVYGLDTKQEENLLAIRQQVGMVFQNPDNQIVSNVVEEDVAFAPENLGVASEEIRRRVDAALEAVGMLAYKKHAPHLLSGGQKQRVAIAGVLAMQPKTIVLDEPTAMRRGGRRSYRLSKSSAASRTSRSFSSRTIWTRQSVPTGSLRWTTAKSLPTARRRRSSCRLTFSSA